MNAANANSADASSAIYTGGTDPALRPARPMRRKGRRWGVALAVFLLALAVFAALGWAMLQAAMSGAGGLHHDFDIMVNGQPWTSDALGQLLGWGIAAAVIGGLVLLALALVLPMALGALLLCLLLVGGLVVGVIALPVLLVLAVVMLPFLALGGLAWAIFG